MHDDITSSIKTTKNDYLFTLRDNLHVTSFEFSFRKITLSIFNIMKDSRNLSKRVREFIVNTGI